MVVKEKWLLHFDDQLIFSRDWKAFTLFFLVNVHEDIKVSSQKIERIEHSDNDHRFVSLIHPTP